MADYLFLPYLAHGHVNPMLAVAAELVRRGEEVGFAVSGEFAGQVAAVGARVVPVPGHDVRVPAGRGAAEMAERAGLLAARWHGWAVAARVVRRHLAAYRPDVVLADVRMPWAGPLVRRAGVPLVSMCTTHAGVVRRRGLMLVNAPRELQPPLARSREALFVAPLVRPAEPEAALDPLGWAGERRPTLLVAPGTVFARSEAFFRRVIEEFAGTEWSVLMATGQTPMRVLGPLPPNFLARPWLPQRRLLRHTTVLFGHGGMNSVQEALLAAVPMIVAPCSREQARTARRLVRLGLAARAGTDLLRRAERVAADERMRAARLAMRERLLAAPGAALAADVLGRIAAGGNVESVTSRDREPIWSH
ncbi:glycosyltransferase [Amycolatopsis sp. A1MSW2902]|uniref:glycosyltransferase n=1 Tax=Amycolatopsis sp. A1MSW2902 TaxID=687413 RepID=UPI00307F0A9F